MKHHEWGRDIQTVIETGRQTHTLRLTKCPACVLQPLGYDRALVNWLWQNINCSSDDLDVWISCTFSQFEIKLCCEVNHHQQQNLLFTIMSSCSLDVSVLPIAPSFPVLHLCLSILHMMPYSWTAILYVTDEPFCGGYLQWLEAVVDSCMQWVRTRMALSNDTTLLTHLHG